MTTIAYRDGVLAADSQGGRGNCILPTIETKLFRLWDGRAAAIIGGLAHGMKLLHWIQSDREASQPEGDARVVVLGADGIEVFEDGYHYREQCSFNAWGSGMAVALGALYAGASAEEAVRIAALVDPETGGEVVSMEV